MIGEGKVFSDGFVQTPCPPLSAYVVQYEQDGIIELLFEGPLDLPHAEAFLLGGCSNYCHWVMDFLPRLQFYTRHIPLLVNERLMAFQRESLRLLGIPSDLLVELDYPRAYRVHNLLQPSTCSSVAMPRLPFQPAVVDWLRGAFAHLSSSRHHARRFFISRAGAAETRNQRLLNHDEITGVAMRHGFEIVACENLPFAEQVSLFSEASIIAGPHGAGFTNMVFAPEDTRIVELIGPNFAADKRGASLAYIRLAAIRGQNVTRVVGRSGGTPVEMNHPGFETYTIAPSDFERALRDL